MSDIKIIKSCFFPATPSAFQLTINIAGNRTVSKAKCMVAEQ